MPVGKAVRSDMTTALEHLEEVNNNIRYAEPSITLLHSAQALVHSSSAFFHPTMVAMLYFPTEHKYAVYTPLFAPIAVPLVVTLLKEIRNWRARKAGKPKSD